MDKIEFQECESCAIKPGTPVLCPSCLNNRQAIFQSQVLTDLQKAWLERCPVEEDEYDYTVEECDEPDHENVWYHPFGNEDNPQRFQPMAYIIRRPKKQVPEWKAGDVIWSSHDQNDVPAMIVYQAAKFQLFYLWGGTFGSALFDSVVELVEYYKPRQGISRAELLRIAAEGARAVVVKDA